MQENTKHMINAIETIPMLYEKKKPRKDKIYHKGDYKKVCSITEKQFNLMFAFLLI